VKLRAAMQEAFRLATTVNQYLDQNAPWQAVKTDKESAAITIYTALKAIDSLKVLFAPFLPFSCEKLNGLFNYETPLFGEPYTETVTDTLGEHTVLRYHGEHIVNLSAWKPSELKPGTKLNPPLPLFIKLEEKIVEEERARLGK
jgi:methionyl-tRNA synthetase